MRTWKPYLGLAAILAVIIASYSGTLKNSFHFDDYHTIVNNPYIRDTGNIPDFFTSLKTGSGDVRGYGAYRPLTTATLAVNYRVSGLEPWSYHIFNIAVHLAVVVLVFFISVHFLRMAGASPYLALLAAGIFGLHPVHTNAVTYVIARSALLCTLFYLTSFYSYVRSREKGGKAWFVLSLISFAAALFSKELAVTLPFAVLLYELLVVKEKRLRGLVLLAALVLLDLLYAVARYAMLLHAGKQEAVRSTAAHLMAQPWIIISYLRLFVLPAGLNFYPDPHVPATPADPAFILPALIIALALALVVYLSRKDGLSAFFLAWFFVALMPETFANLRELMVEYRMYLPSAGLAMLVSLTAARLRRVAPVRTGYFAVGVALLFGCFFYLTYERNKVYRDDVTLWQDAVSKSPKSAIAHAALGSAYLEAGRYPEAAEALYNGFLLDPRMPGAPRYYNNLGLALESTGERYKAYEAYKKSLSMAPDNPAVLLNMGMLCLKLSRRDEAAGYLRKALAAQPGNAAVRGLLEQVEGGS